MKCPKRYPERLLREPLVDWNFRPLPWWGEFLAALSVPLLFFLCLAFVAWNPRVDR